MDENKCNALLKLYETHKREISTRRLFELVAWINSLLFYGFVFVLILVKRAPDGLTMGNTMKAIVTIALVIVGDIFVYFLVKNYRRRCAVKRAVLKIEESLGLFKEGEYLPDSSIYPEEWKNYGEERWGSTISRLCVIMSIALLTIIVLWVS